MFLRIGVRSEAKNERVELSVDRPIVIGRYGGDSNNSEYFLRVEDASCSRRQLRLQVTPDGELLIENLSQKVAVLVMPSLEIEPLGSRIVKCPTKLAVGKTHFSVKLTDHKSSDAPGVSPQPHSTIMTVSREPVLLASSIRSPSLQTCDTDTDDLIAWFEALISIQQSAAGSDSFYEEVSEAMVRLIGLDVGMVLLRRGDRWAIAGLCGATEQNATFSRTVLNRMLVEAKTVYELPHTFGDAPSLMSLNAVVASPITSIQREIIGAVYGARNADLRIGQEAKISDLEARLVQVLAACAATGLARLEKEAEAARFRIQFEEFCSAEVVRELQRNPDLLKATQRVVTVLFCDVRGFTSLSERLQPEITYAIMTDILDGISECVLESCGVVIDFYGDAVAAMWNAPCEQSDHAYRGLKCAETILGRVQAINKKWQATIDSGLCVGIGIHTGTALVGNVGGGRRIKYGPRGTTVNLASRLEGLTRHLGTPVLCTGQTADLLAPHDMQFLRIGKFQVVGINSPVDVFLPETAEGPPGTAEFTQIYLSALQAFEKGSYHEAVTALSELITCSPETSLLPIAQFFLAESRRRISSPDERHHPWIAMQNK